MRGAVCVVILLFVERSFSLVNNSAIEARNALEESKTSLKRAHVGLFAARRQALRPEQKPKHGHSTSSESKDKSNSKSEEDTLGESASLDDSKDKTTRKMPKSSEERWGWRKWHRKCTPCPEDMLIKWRDPNVKWICGAFQRARRSFKSLCMMHYRNCQDGTMFTKIHDHRCHEKSANRPFGDHFFYEYKVVLPMDSSDSKTESTEETAEERSEYSSSSE